jgi:predicted lysophospholipase L1 biosynthesis ABC-type transport system permease subunit
LCLSFLFVIIVVIFLQVESLEAANRRMSKRIQRQQKEMLAGRRRHSALLHNLTQLEAELADLRSYNLSRSHSPDLTLLRYE